MEQSSHLLVKNKQDDLDDGDIAAFTLDMGEKTEEFKTLGQ